ncbi:hypothetical protein QTP88_005136 [Uroleucon formosanum]
MKERRASCSPDGHHFEKTNLCYCCRFKSSIITATTDLRLLTCIRIPSSTRRRLAGNRIPSTVHQLSKGNPLPSIGVDERSNAMSARRTMPPWPTRRTSQHCTTCRTTQPPCTTCRTIPPCTTCRTIPPCTPRRALPPCDKCRVKNLHRYYS